jgi:hypothetical protein
MCGWYANPKIKGGYINDLRRGRLSDPTRFWRLRKYAYGKWEKTKDMRHANQWRSIMEAIDQREPR